jgi:hypothetical protein
MSNETNMSNQFQQMSNEELLALHHHLVFETIKPVPIALVIEIQNRGLFEKSSTEEEYQLKANKIK